MTTIKELLDDVTEQEINEQRIMFVRETAARMLIGRNLDFPWEPRDFKQIWRLAQLLWDTKPEDC